MFRIRPEQMATVARRAEELGLESLAAGRADALFEITVSHGGPMLARDDVERYAAAGAHRVVVLPWRRGREADVQLGRLAAAVLR